MRSVSCIIVDDDEVFVKNFSKQVETLSFIRILGACSSYGEALVMIKAKPADFILLDVNLKAEDGLNGFDFLRHSPQLPPVIMISNYPEYAVESYAIGKAKDFLVKPFDNSRLLLAVNRSLSIDTKPGQISNGESVFFKMGRRFQLFDIPDIDYFEGYGIYTKVWSKGIATVINDSLAEIEISLGNKNFIRVHKSYIINLNKLVGFDSSKLYLKNGSVPIGISYREKLEGLLRLFGDSNIEIQ